MLTDIVESTELWERAPVAMRAAMLVHDRLIDAAIEAHDGVAVRPRGEGDSRFAVFRRASDAVSAATRIVSSFVAERWATPEPVRVRVGVHTGEADLRDGDYYGTAVNLCARLRGLAVPNQILVSEATSRLVVRSLSDITVEEVGAYPLKGISLPERVFALRHPDLPVSGGVAEARPTTPGDSGVAGAWSGTSPRSGPRRRAGMVGPRSPGSRASADVGSPATRIFLSYRRDDSAPYAGRIHDTLSERFGPDRVFMDIDTISPGNDFVVAIDEALAECDVLLAVIGHTWLSCTDRDGQQRLSNTEDLIRLEIEVGLARGLRVIPVLVGGAPMPSRHELPESISALARRNAIELSDRRWRWDIEDLIGAIERAGHQLADTDIRTPRPALGEVAPTPLSSGGTRSTVRRRWIAAAIAVTVAVAAAATVVTTLGSGRSKAPGAVPGAAPIPLVWKEIPSAPRARQQLAATVLNGAIWVLGGLEATGATPTVDRYDVTVSKWGPGPPLPMPLHHEMAVTYRGEIIVMGGWIPVGSVLDAVASDRVFALRGNRWVELPRLHHPRAAGAAVVVGSKIVVAGGQADGRLVSPTEVFDGTRWKDAADIPKPRDHVAAASDGRYAYLVGGRFLSSDKNTTAFERYDPAADAWQKLPDMPTARGGLGAAVVGTRIIAIGGEYPTGVFDAVEAYDLERGAWTIALPPIRGRHGLAVVTVGKSVYAIGGAARPTHTDPVTTAEVLDLSNPPPVLTWHDLRDAPTARQEAGSAVVDGVVWVAGGFDATTGTRKVEGYDPAIDTWKSGPDLPLALAHVMAVAYKGELVVLGGETPTGPLSANPSDRVFVLRSNAWVPLPSLHRPRAAGAAVVVGDKIIVAGGQASDQLVPTTEIFDGTQWRDAAPIPTPRDHVAAVADSSFVYVVGGWMVSSAHLSGAVERYDAATDTWRKLPDMPTPRGSLGAVLVGRQLFAIGGEYSAGVYGTVEAFDLDGGFWTTSFPSMRARSGMATVAIGRSIYVIGGARSPTRTQFDPVPTVQVLQLP